MGVMNPSYISEEQHHEHRLGSTGNPNRIGRIDLDHEFFISKEFRSLKKCGPKFQAAPRHELILIDVVGGLRGSHSYQQLNIRSSNPNIVSVNKFPIFKE